MTHTTTARVEQPSSWMKVLATSILASIIVSLVILAFTWPTKTMEYKNLPISITGPELTVSQFEQGLKDKGIETFDLKQANSREEAERHIKERETYGAIVFTEEGTSEVLTAPSASAAATQMLNNVAQQMNAQVQQRAATAKTEALQKAAQEGGQQGAVATKQLEQLAAENQKLQEAQVKTTAIVPLGEGDPNGMGLAVSAFPLVMGGMLGAVLSCSLVNGTLRRFTAAGLYGIFGGLLMTGILSGWFGFIPGDFTALWAAFGVTVFATTAFIIGLCSLIGFGPAMGIGALITMFLGNPLSGASAPWQFTPEPWGFIGQLMVPGASNTLLRNIAYFPEASNGMEWAVLFTWAGVGLVLGAIGWEFKERRVLATYNTTDTPEEKEPAQKAATTQAAA